MEAKPEQLRPSWGTPLIGAPWKGEIKTEPGFQQQEPDSGLLRRLFPAEAGGGAERDRVDIRKPLVGTGCTEGGPLWCSGCGLRDGGPVAA